MSEYLEPAGHTPPQTHQPAPAIPAREVTVREVWRLWLPLAASWLLMGAELPILSAVVARLPNPEINLAAYGGVVFPIALIIEGPIIMLLAASTALSRDWASYRRIRRFMTQASILLTTIHILIAFTPLYDLVVTQLIRAPAAVVEPGRIGLMLMTPWTWAIAYRRFNQGVLIRFGHSDSVGIGTLVRLLSGCAVLVAGFLYHQLPGIIVATAAVSTGVLAEAGYVRWRVHPVLKQQVQPATPVEPPLSSRALLRFYIPLALTAFISLCVQPVLTAAISRLPQAVASLAAWPALNGLVFMTRAPGLAYNEVVIALLPRPRGYQALRRFNSILAWSLTAALTLIVISPLADLWFGGVCGLTPPLTALARQALWAGILTPALAVLASWYQGILVHSHHTRPVTESVTLFLATSSLLLVGAVLWGRMPGLLAGLIALTVGACCMVGWQFHRSRQARQSLSGAPR